MPPLEAMMCGAPVVVCHNSSLPEVVGEAAIFVDEDDPADTVRALQYLHEHVARSELIRRGYQQAAKFTFKQMAEQLAVAFVETHEKLASKECAKPSVAWAELRSYQRDCQSLGVDLSKANAAKTSPVHAALLAQGEGLQGVLEELESIKNSPFWKLRKVVLSVLRWLRR